MGSPLTDQIFPVAVSIMSRHLANCILKQAGIGQKL
jgi:hypothetical protein